MISEDHLRQEYLNYFGFGELRNNYLVRKYPAFFLLFFTKLIIGYFNQLCYFAKKAIVTFLKHVMGLHDTNWTNWKYLESPISSGLCFVPAVHLVDGGLSPLFCRTRMLHYRNLICYFFVAHTVTLFNLDDSWN